MLWVSKGNIYSQPVCVFMLVIMVITIIIEVYLWFSLLLSSCFGSSSYNFPVVVFFALPAMPDRLEEDT